MATATGIGRWFGVVGRGVLTVAIVAVLVGVVEWIGAGRVGAATFGIGDRARVIDGRLNLRSNAGLAASVVAVLNDGALLDVIGGPKTASGMTWYKVETLDEATGWVSGTYLAAAAATGEFSQGDTVRVVDGRLNLRSAPGLLSGVVQVLEDGTGAAVVDGPVAIGDYVWYEIFGYGFGRGWVAGAFLVADNGISMCDGGGECPDVVFPGDLVRVVTGALNVRTMPGTNSPVIDVLVTGETGVFTGDVGGANEMMWIEISGSFGTGWVARKYVVFE